MKLLTNGDMKKIKEKYTIYKSERIIMNSKHVDKEKVICFLLEQITYLYGKVGLMD